MIYYDDINHIWNTHTYKRISIPKLSTNHNGGEMKDLNNCMIAHSVNVAFETYHGDRATGPSLQPK